MPANSRIMDQIVKQGRVFWPSRSWLLVLSTDLRPLRFARPLHYPLASGEPRAPHPRILGEINEREDSQDDRIGNLRSPYHAMPKSWSSDGTTTKLPPKARTVSCVSWNDRGCPHSTSRSSGIPRCGSALLQSSGRSVDPTTHFQND